ncbi:hypothetical protein V8F06_008055 [Rhypophila decipiens]
MLTLKSLVTLAAMVVISATAAPAPAPEPEAAPSPASGDFVIAVAVPEDSFSIAAHPGEGCVKLCQDHYFQGTCYTICTNDGQCATLSGGLNDWTSSIDVVNWPAWECTFYQHAQCQGASFTTHYDESLHDSGGWWADRISSIRCSYRCGSPFC